MIPNRRDLAISLAPKTRTADLRKGRPDKASLSLGAGQPRHTYV